MTTIPAEDEADQIDHANKYIYKTVHSVFTIEVDAVQYTPEELLIEVV